MNRDCIQKHGYDPVSISNKDVAALLDRVKNEISKYPESAKLYYELGLLYRKCGQWKRALPCLRKAIDIKPDFSSAGIELGLTLSGNGFLSEAIQVISNSLLHDPDNVNLLNNLGVIFRDQGKLESAAKCFQKAQLIANESYDVCFNLANTLREMGQFDDAKKQYHLAAKLYPNSHPVYVGLGLLYLEIEKYDLAAKNFRRVLEIQPDNDMALWNLVNTLMYMCEWEELEKWNPKLDRATEYALGHGEKLQETPFVNICRHADPELNLAVAKAFSKDIEIRSAFSKSRLDFSPRPPQKPKITIGYLSNNFKNHPTSHLIHRMLELHDRSKFNVFCYSYGKDDKSIYRQYIEKGCDKFVDFSQLDEEERAIAIYNDQVDILIDLVGYMAGCRPGICALRPAPIQVRWLGMAGSSGAEFYDYLIADKIVIPENEFAYYSEKVIYMPHCYQVNSIQSLSELGKPERTQYGLPENGIVFASFHTTYKIDATIFKVWMNILKRAPDSVLWVMPGSEIAAKNMINAARLNGVKSDRIIIAEKIGKQEHLLRLRHADIMFDTINVNGAITTSDALQAGVPVITMKGRHFASRMAASILSAAGLTELTGESITEYEELAVDLATHPAKLEMIKNKLKQNLHTMPLFQTRQFVGELEKVYLKILHQIK